MKHPDGIPRLAQHELDAGLQELLKPTVERLGYLGEFFAVAGHVPGAVNGFMQYTGAVKAPLSDRQNEVLALSRAADCSVPTTSGSSTSAWRGGSACRAPWIAAAAGRPGADPAELADDERLLRRLRWRWSRATANAAPPNWRR